MARKTLLTMSRLRVAGALLLTVATLFVTSATRVPEARAATATWDGGGSDNNWTTAANWEGDEAPSPGDSLVFPGGVDAADRSTFNNFAPGTQFNSITFTDDSYLVNGNGLRISCCITNLASPAQGGAPSALSLPIAVPAAGVTVTASFAGESLTLGSLGAQSEAVELTGTLTLTGSGNINLLRVTGTDGVIKNGTGTAIFLGNASTYTGPTVINAGRVEVRQPLTGTAITVQGGTLMGAGINAGMSQAVTMTSGAISPGTGAFPTASFPTGPLTISGGTYGVDLRGTNSFPSDQLQVTGGVRLGGTLEVTPDSTSQGQSFTIIDNDGTDPVVGTFGGLPEGATFTAGSTQFRISYKGGDGNDVTLTAGPFPSPTPSPTSSPGLLLPMTVIGTAKTQGGLAPLGTPVRAYVGGTLCGSSNVTLLGAFLLLVNSAAQAPGCGTPGVALRFELGGAPATATSPVAFQSLGVALTQLQGSTSP